MKTYSHLYRLGEIRASKKALRHYALYRSCALSGASDMTALIDFHRYESTGVLAKEVSTFTEFSTRNAYANGKWVLKITQDQIVQDLLDGNFCKAEFFSSKKLREIFSEFGIAPKTEYRRASWFWDKALMSVRAGALFS